MSKLYKNKNAEDTEFYMESPHKNLVDYSKDEENISS